MEEYRHSFRQLVAYVGGMLHRKPDRETLECVYRDKLSGRTQGKKRSGVGLLQAMEEAGVFGYRHPEGLLAVLGDARREDLKAAVKEFISEFIQSAFCALVRSYCLPCVSPYRTLCGRVVLWYVRQRGSVQCFSG